MSCIKSIDYFLPPGMANMKIFNSKTQRLQEKIKRIIKLRDFARRTKRESLSLFLCFLTVCQAWEIVNGVAVLRFTNNVLF